MRQERPDRLRSPKPKHRRPQAKIGRDSATPVEPGASGARRERIAKVMARAGLCSRRDAEVWIAEGRVAVNGKLLTSPAVSVGPDDKIIIDGQPLAQRQRTRLFLFHKPRGLVTTNKDPQGRPTIFDYLAQHHPEAPRLVSVGRLDINTEGLLLLTNDGGLARLLELPATGWLRRYRVRANGETDQASLDRLAGGITLEGIHYAGIEAVLDRIQGANCWLTMGLREGKNREVKRVLEHLGLTVNRLIRLSFGPFQLGELAEGKMEEVRTRVLRDQLGPTLLKESGADLEAPNEAPQRQETRPERASGSPPVRRAKPRPRHAAPDPAPPKPRGKPQPGPRKHVSALRAESKKRKDESGAPGRRRIERGATEDRKGRVVEVERRVATAPVKKKIAGAQKRQRSGDKNGGNPRPDTAGRKGRLPKRR
jgi:23S rRNA pseudouridine2605 synthase